MQKKKDFLEIDGKLYESRLIMGTSLYPNQKVLKKCLEVSETELVTLSIRRVKPDTNCVKVSNLLMHSSTEKIADIN